MTAFTVNSGGTVLWDSLSGGSTNATLDVYTVSLNTTLKIDTDTYQCANHSTAFGSLDTVTPSGTGGRLLIDGSVVRCVAFDTGSSTVPAIGTSITQGGVSGPLLGVWANWLSEPLAAGAAMPATGYIKLRSVSGGAFAAGALGGISASATGADDTGWIEVRGADTAVITSSRVFPFEVQGAWFELGTTSGSRGQVVPFPTCATVANTFTALQIETGVGTGIYEWWTSVGNMPTSSGTATDANRGKLFWHTTSGARIGSDGTNNVGHLPGAGRKIRMPNVILTTCTRTAGGSGPRVLPSAANGDGSSTRMEWSTSNGGVVTLSKCVSQWAHYFATPAQVNVLDSALSDKLKFYRHIGALNVRRSAVAMTQAQTQSAFDVLSTQAGGVVEDNVFVRYDNTSGPTSNIQYINGVAFARNTYRFALNSVTGSYGAQTHTASNDCTWDDEVHIGGRMLLQQSANAVITNTRYIYTCHGATTTSNSQQCFWLDRCPNILIDGLSFPEASNHPYGSLFLLAGTSVTTVRNIGSHASPLDLGASNGSNMLFESGSNVSGLLAQRIYTINTRSAQVSFNPSDSGIVFESVFSDFGDSSYYQGQNMQFKGCGYGSQSFPFGAVYGSIWGDHFTSATAGRVFALCCEPTATSGAKITITAGTPRFDSAGNCLMVAVGDQLTWEMDYRALGHTALANVAPTLSGTNTGNFTFEFQIDTGGGFGSWLTLNAANLSAQTISHATGFKLKFRATVTTAAAGNLLNGLRVDTVSTSSAQADNLYPLDLASFTVVANVSLVGAEIRVYDMDGTPAGSLGTELAGVESSAGATFAMQGEAANTVWVQIMLAGYTEYGAQTTIINGTYTATLTAELNT